MMKDYSDRYRHSTPNRQRVSGRRQFGTDREGQILKAIGLVVVSAMLVGVGFSLWFGWKIRTDLDALVNDNQIRQQLTSVNRELTARRDGLLTREKMEEMAAEIDLYPPTAKQIRRP